MTLHPDTERRLVKAATTSSTLTNAELARTYGVSAKTLERILRKHDAHRPAKTNVRRPNGV